MKKSNGINEMRANSEAKHPALQAGGPQFEPGTVICLCSDCHSRFHDKLPAPPKSLELVPSTEINRQATKALGLMLRFAEGGPLEDVPRLKTRLGQEMGITAKAAGKLVRHLGRIGILENGYIDRPRFSQRFRQR